MSNWMNIYDGVFFITIATILAGSFGLAIKYCLKSKCEKFSVCFGIFEIRRRVDLEVEEEMAQMELGLSTPTNTNTNTNNLEEKKHNI